MKPPTLDVETRVPKTEIVRMKPKEQTEEEIILAFAVSDDALAGGARGGLPAGRGAATGVPCGFMDQMVSALGQAARAAPHRLPRCRRSSGSPFPRTLAVAVVDSGVRRSLSDGRYAERRAACEAAAARIGVASLRDATPEQVADDPVARHVVSENERVHRMVRALRAGDLVEAGASSPTATAACATTSRSRRRSSTPWSSGCSASAPTALGSQAAGSAAA